MIQNEANDAKNRRKKYAQEIPLSIYPWNLYSAPSR